MPQIPMFSMFNNLCRFLKYMKYNLEAMINLVSISCIPNFSYSMMSSDESAAKPDDMKHFGTNAVHGAYGPDQLKRKSAVTPIFNVNPKNGNSIIYNT